MTAGSFLQGLVLRRQGPLLLLINLDLGDHRLKRAALSGPIAMERPGRTTRGFSQLRLTSSSPSWVEAQPATINKTTAKSTQRRKVITHSLLGRPCLRPNKEGRPRWPGSITGTAMRIGRRWCLNPRMRYFADVSSAVPRLLSRLNTAPLQAKRILRVVLPLTETQRPGSGPLRTRAFAAARGIADTSATRMSQQ